MACRLFGRRVAIGAVCVVGALGGCSSFSERGDCVHRGEAFDEGDTFPEFPEGCSTCRCESDGSVSCTLLLCVDPVPPQGSGGSVVPGPGGSGGSTGGSGGALGDGGHSGNGSNTCDALEDELALIQSCQTDVECGQVLQGTSCGCTRDLVARNDANASAFFELLQGAADAGCTGFGSTCDCPETYGFVCLEGRCAHDYVDDSPPECSTVEVGSLCVRGSQGETMELLEVGTPLSIQVTPFGCFSSSCSTAVVAECTVSGAGPFTVDGEFCIGAPGGAQGCTPDCSGGGYANCASTAVLTPGQHTVTLGDLAVTFTVPGSVPFGGLCDGAPF